MPASLASAAWNTLIQTDATGSFITVAEIESFDGPNVTLKTVDVTNMNSPSAVEEFLATLVNPGEMSLTLNYIPTGTTQKQITTDVQNRAKRNFKIIFSDQVTTATFSGWWTEFKPAGKKDDAYRAAAKVKVTGLITFPT